MTKTSLTILWLIAAGLGGSVAWYKMNQTHQAEATTSRTRGQTLFSEFPSDKIARIHIKSAKDETTLVKGDKGWVVEERGEYPADASRVNELLNTLEEVKVTQGIQAGPSYGKRFGMDPAADTPEEHGLQIIFSAANGTQLASVTLGKTLESNSSGLFGMGGGVTGRFVRNRAEPNAVYVTSETFPRVVATPKDWLKDEFISIEKIKSIAVAMPNKKDFKPWKLTRPDEVSEFKLEGAAKGETLDQPAVTPLKSLFSYARFEDVEPKSALKELEKSPDLRVATIETVEGFAYTIRFAPKKAEKKDGKSPAAAASNYLLTVKVDAKIPKARKKGKDEKKEDAKKKDDAFAKRAKELKEKLDKEKQLEGRVYEITRWTIDALLKNRSQLVKKGAVSKPVGPGVRMPPHSGRRIEAVTPPIPVPPLHDKTKAQPKPAPVAKPQPKPRPAPAKPAPGRAPKPAAKKPSPSPAPAAKPAPAKPKQPSADQGKPKAQPKPAAKPQPKSQSAKPAPPKPKQAPAPKAEPKAQPKPKAEPAPKPQSPKPSAVSNTVEVPAAPKNPAGAKLPEQKKPEDEPAKAGGSN